ncbi:hypothetical protein H0H92_013341 [Tricholoma furcatifolium]|nr:hypothetical protein H0H92_013341 [Tricholoma furcatifolium]
MLQDIHNLLSRPEVEQIVHIHPNDPQADLFPEWPPWQQIFDNNKTTPLLASIRAAQLPRDPIVLDVTIPQSTFGMSPKKHHEVSRMTQYIANLGLPEGVHIVDVGAGQGYLTRALHSHFGTPVLALDNDLVQTHGSQARGGSDFTGITHRTIHLTPVTLVAAIDDWIPASPTKIPVLLVALHACGSLTPDLFRAVLSLPKNHFWYPVAIVAVGCCYNLMHPPDDFPLYTAPLPHPLPASAYQMAAQIPDTWYHSAAHLASTTLAIRKVVWRALLGRLYVEHISDPLSSNSAVTDTGSTPAMRRLGRLHDSAYDSWPAFLRIASQRIGVDLAGPSPPSEPPNPSLQRRLESLHVLRCLIGPVVESYIILDRIEWLRDQLSRSEMLKGYDVEPVNLFDQTTGSGRNIALVLKPKEDGLLAGAHD